MRERTAKIVICFDIDEASKMDKTIEQSIGVRGLQK